MPEPIPGKLEIQNSDGSVTTIALDGDNGSISAGVDKIKLTLDSLANASISAGGSGYSGIITLYDDSGKERVVIGSVSPIAAIDGSGKIFLMVEDFSDIDPRDASGFCRLLLGSSDGKKSGGIGLRDQIGNDSIFLDGGGGSIALKDYDRNDSIVLNGHESSMKLKKPGGWNSIIIDGANYSITTTNWAGKDSIVLNGANNIVRIFDGSGKEVLGLDANAAGGGHAGLFLGGGGKPGILVMRDSAGRDSMNLNGLTGDLNIYDENGKRLLAVRGKVKGTDTAGLWIGAHAGDSASGAKAGYLEIRNSSGKPSMILNGFDNSVWMNNKDGQNTIILDGARGDIILQNADCAEDFDICQSELSQVEPGTVMVIDTVNTLRVSSKPYDKRVAGVVSGAGDYKPGLVLDKKQSNDSRKSISLMGKVNCKVDATYSPIEIGDLLTTSSTVGHAMRANDPMKAFGAVIGKALSSAKEGLSMIPILVALQ